MESSYHIVEDFKLYSVSDRYISYLGEKWKNAQYRCYFLCLRYSWGVSPTVFLNCRLKLDRLLYPL